MNLISLKILFFLFNSSSSHLITNHHQMSITNLHRSIKCRILFFNQFSIFYPLKINFELWRYRSASLPRNYENHKNQNCNCKNATLITLSAGSRCSSCRWVNHTTICITHTHTHVFFCFTSFSCFSLLIFATINFIIFALISHTFMTL